MHECSGLASVAGDAPEPPPGKKAPRMSLSVYDVNVLLNRSNEMKTWSYAINSHPDHMIGTVCLHERPWWLALAEWAIFPPEWTYHVPLPKWPRIRFDDGFEASLNEYFGTLGDLVIYRITNQYYARVYNHPRQKHTEIELGYSKVRELFYADSPSFFDQQDDEDPSKKSR